MLMSGGKLSRQGLQFRTERARRPVVKLGFFRCFHTFVMNLQPRCILLLGIRDLMIIMFGLMMELI